MLVRGTRKSLRLLKIAAILLRGYIQSIAPLKTNKKLAFPLDSHTHIFN